MFLKANFYELKAIEILYGKVIEVNDRTSVMEVLTDDEEPPSIGTVFTTRPVPDSMYRWKKSDVAGRM